MKPYCSPGVCSQSVHIALNEAQIDHMIEKVDLSHKTTESGADFTRIDPLDHVPALRCSQRRRSCNMSRIRDPRPVWPRPTARSPAFACRRN